MNEQQFRAELEARIESARGPLGPLSRFDENRLFSRCALQRASV